MLGGSLALELSTVFAKQKIGRLAADGASNSSTIALDQIHRFIALEASEHAAGDKGQIVQATVLSGGQRVHALFCWRFTGQDAREIIAAGFLFFPVVLLGRRGSDLSRVST